MLGGMNASSGSPGGRLRPDVPEFLEVVDRGILGPFGAERRVAARAAAAGDVIAPLGLFGQSEELLGQFPRLASTRSAGMP